MTRNSARSLEKTLRRLSLLPGDTLVADLGSEDDSRALAKRCGADVMTVPFADYADAANKICGRLSGWILWCQPGEILTSGHDSFDHEDLDPHSVYAVYHVAKDVVTRPARLWHQPSRMPAWVNPVFEDNSLSPDAVADLIFANETTLPQESLLLSEWLSSEPHNPQVHYYLAMSALSAGDLRRFRQEAATFLFLAREVTDAVVLVWYYSACVEVRAGGEEAKALGFLALAIAHRPWMAEFWCLAAELFGRKGQHGRATALYENAMLFGQRRPGLDGLPVEVRKYKQEPQEYLDKVRTSIESRLSLRPASGPETPPRPHVLSSSGESLVPTPCS